jgi:hypothetical protein
LSGGKGIQCDELGQPAKRCTQYCSGYFDYRRRAEKANHEPSKHLLPKRPYSLAQLRDALQPSSLSKLDGYAQFPRPLEISQSTTASKTRLELSKQLQLHVHPQTQTQTRLRQGDWTLRGSCPSMLLRSGANPQLTCTFFAPQRSSKALAQSARPALHPTSTSISISTGQSMLHGERSVLPSRDLLPNSTLKANYVTSLRTTLKPLQNLLRLSEATCNLLSKHVDTAEAPNRRPVGLSYQQLRSELRREEAELEGYQPPPDKPPRVNVKGVYSTVVPSPADLFSRALVFREQANPAATAETLKRNVLDRTLLQKRRQQRVLKTRAMEAAIRAQEKALAEEIRLKNQQQALEAYHPTSALNAH